MEKGIVAYFLTRGKSISDAYFSPNNKWLVIRYTDNTSKVWLIEKEIENKFLKQEKNIRHASFSPDSKWLVTTNIDDIVKIWSIEKGTEPNFLKEEKSIRYAHFSPDSKWLLTRYVNGTVKVWSIEKGIEYDFLKQEENISPFEFSEKRIYLFVTKKDKHRVKTYETTTGKLIQTLWLNKIPTQVDIIDNLYLYVTVGKAIVKTNLQTQQGDLMSFGDGEPLDYEYDEIVEWKKAFGDQYLLPLDDKIKKKYGIKD